MLCMPTANGPAVKLPDCCRLQLNSNRYCSAPQTDAIVKITSACICGSDLHMYTGAFPGVRKGDLLGHEVCTAAPLPAAQAVRDSQPVNLLVVVRKLEPRRLAPGIVQPAAASP